MTLGSTGNKASGLAVDRTRLYDTPLDFFDPAGNAIMKLTPSAAIGVCLESTARQLVVLGVEGGIHDDRGFEARLDCLWDGISASIDQADAHQNNLKAAQFIRGKSAAHNAFIITVAPLTGYQGENSK